MHRKTKSISDEWEVFPYKFEPVPSLYDVYFLYGVGRQAFVRLRDFNESQTCESCLNSSGTSDGSP